ncbi:MAG: hypothetical protein KF795_19150 [Labilithrix sp.]|nr:hypothetical protein [Labilithrix sp.]
MRRRRSSTAHGPRGRAYVAGAVLLATATQAPAASADESPASVTVAYSRYELAAIQGAERLLGARVDPNAEGKLVESVETVRLDPIEKKDPAPLALNAVHVTTKEEVILHEVLLRVGAPYHKVTADESARNIRRFMKVSVVAVVPMTGSAPDRVRLVVITKDVWSLIADVDFHVTPGGIEHMMLELEETNLFGRQVELSTHAIIQPESVAFGGAYVAPRFFGRWLSFHAESNIIINRRSGDPEGSFGDARIERPLFSTRTNWAWNTGIYWRDEVHRRYTNAAVATFDGSVPWVYRARRIEYQAGATRSFGWARKNDFTLGASIARDVYRVPDQPDLDPEAVARFSRAAVPVGEARTMPFVQWRTYANDFLRIVDFETLALQEDYRLGYDLVVRGYPIARALGSTRDLAGLRLGAVYTLALGDGFVRALLDSTTEAETHRISDAWLSGELRIVSPRTPIGRLIFDAAGTNRWRNYLNRLSYLGGEDRLRGWPTRHFVGKNVFAMNVELRTRPIELFAVQLGGALFYDNGRAFNGSFEEISPAHSVGAGFRIVFPQLDRSVIRGDFGFPVTTGGLPPGVMPMSFYFSFGQAFRATHMVPPFGP